VKNSQTTQTMAADGEWTLKGASLSDVTAQKEYGVTRDFIIQGIQDGKLEYREGSVWGNPYLKILRSQLEKYISTELGPKRLTSGKSQSELSKIKKEIGVLKKRLSALERRKIQLEKGRSAEDLLG
jgi:hypothetical protein